MYAHFGLAAYHGQCFETTLCNLLMLDARVKGEVTNIAEIDKLELEQQKKPLGRLITALRDKVALPANAKDVFTLALERRNFLNHHFFRQHARDFMAESGRVRMLAELKGIQQAIELADQMGTRLTMALLQFLGVTPNMVHAEFEQLKKSAQPHP